MPSRPIRPLAVAFEYDRLGRRGIDRRRRPWPVAKGGGTYLLELPLATYKGLPGLLSDALPDDFGNALIDAWMARQGITTSQLVTALDRLAYMGRRGMGARSRPRADHTATGSEPSSE